MIPAAQMMIKAVSSFGFTALRSIISDGRLSVVTAIIKDRIVPRLAPFARRLSATGIVPKISAYMGTPTSVAKITANGFPLPKTLSIHACGITLWIKAPIPTPTKI